MHKTLIQTLLAAFYAIPFALRSLGEGWVATAPLEGGGVMLIYRRNAMLSGGGKLSAKSYVQDGLVAMWDGIENAGWGVHDANATEWKDLTEHRYDLACSSTSTWGYNCLSHSSNDSHGAAYRNGNIVAVAVEVCFNVTKWINWGLVFSNAYDSRDFDNSAMRILSLPSSGIQTADNRIYTGQVFTTGTVCISCRKDALYLNSKAVIADSYGSGGWAYDPHFCLFARYNGQYQLFGDIYSVRIYSRALTAAEIAANYAIDKARFNLPEVT